MIDLEKRIVPRRKLAFAQPVSEERELAFEKTMAEILAESAENRRTFICVQCGRKTFYKMYEPYCTRRCAWHAFNSMSRGPDKIALKQKLDSIPPVSEWFT